MEVAKLEKKILKCVSENILGRSKHLINLYGLLQSYSPCPLLVEKWSRYVQGEGVENSGFWEERGLPSLQGSLTARAQKQQEPVDLKELTCN